MLPGRMLWRLTAAVSAAVLLAAWTLALLHGRDIRQRTYAEAGQKVELMAEAYAAHARLSLSVADETLRRLQDILEDQGEAEFIRAARIISHRDTYGQLNRASLIGPDGIMRANFLNGVEAPLLDVNDRDYYLAFRSNPRDRLFVNEPVRGKASGQWIILFARPVRDGDRFAGVIFVGLETSRLGGLVEPLDPENLLVTLLSPGGRVIARSRDPEQSTGRQIDLPDEFISRPHAMPLTSPIDGLTRLSAARQVPDWGMYVVAGIDQARLDAEIAAHDRTALIPAVLLTLLLLPATLLVRRAVHAQHAAERARQTEAARSRKVLENMAEGVLLIDPDGSIGFANGAACRWLNEPLGRPFGEAIAASNLSLVTEDGSPFAVADPLTHLCLHSGLSLENAWLLDQNAEETRWLSLQAHPLFDEEAHIGAAIATIVDRSEEHERIAEAEMARTVLARMSDAVLITDAHTTIRMVNEAFCRLSGYSEQETVGRTPAFLGSARHDEAFWREVWSTLRERASWSGEVWNRHRNGSEYCVWHTITAVRDLRGRIVRYVAVSRDITEQQAQQAELWQRANFDPLTGLANRTRFDDRLAQQLHRAVRHGESFAVCYLDLDRFKPVNDTLGHAAGDAVLRLVAQRVLALVRKDDLPARLGGDEFALLMPGLTAADARQVAEKIIAAVGQPFVLDEGVVGIGVSIGIAFYPYDGRDAAQLGAAADRALYAAKDAGRNTVRLAGDPSPG